MTVDPSDISVIVRGLVVGTPDDAPEARFTQRVLARAREVLPGSQLILSTWEGSDLSGLDYDEAALHREPERVFMLQDDGTEKFIAANNQIVTTRDALPRATRPYVLSIRSDLLLEHDGFLRYFARYNQHAPPDILRRRVLTLPTYNPRRSALPFLFDVCDWMYFGTREDIGNIFSIPLMTQSALARRDPGQLPHKADNLESEQFIWTGFLRKNGYPAELASLNADGPALRELSERSYARYTVMVPASRAGVVCLKMPHAGYGARPWLSQGLYTFPEYQALYNRHNGARIAFVPNPFEQVAYALMLGIRRLLAGSAPLLYKGIVNRVRKLHGSTNLLR